MSSGNPWTRPAEQRLLAMYHGGMSKAAMAAEFGRTVNAIEHRLRMLLPSGGAHSPWTDDEDAILLDGLHECEAFETIAAKLPGRTARAVANRAARLTGKRRTRRKQPSPDRLAAILRSQGWTCIEPPTCSGVMTL